MEYGFYRKNQLVYTSVLKCASTLYNNVVLHNNWTEIQMHDINWQHDHVFGFIMNPIVRYIKGLSEDVFDPTTSRSINNLPVHNDCITFTFHSLPISLVLKDRMHLIDWIPLDTEIKSETLFQILLKKYNIDLVWPVHVNKHESTDEKTKIYNTIKNIINIDNYVVQRGLEVDINFYRTVISKINIYGKTWDEISWMLNK